MSCTPCQANRVRQLISKIRKNRSLGGANQKMADKKIDWYYEDGVMYVKTFLINDKRNRNGWRASWNSIKKNHKSFRGMPGIEYTKCTVHGCRLDHTTGDTYAESRHIQEPYRVSTIIDTLLDDATHTAYAIQRIETKEFADRIERGGIKYLSPSIWPNAEHTTLYNVDDEWYIDTTDWSGLHEAWVHQPAFGHEARIVARCIGGEECKIHLVDSALTAKILSARQFVETDHNRHPEGASGGQGGRFAPKGTGGGGSSYTDMDDETFQKEFDDTIEAFARVSASLEPEEWERLRDKRDAMQEEDRRRDKVALESGPLDFEYPDPDTEPDTAEQIAEHGVDVEYDQNGDVTKFMVDGEDVSDELRKGDHFLENVDSWLETTDSYVNIKPDGKLDTGLSDHMEATMKKHLQPLTKGSGFLTRGGVMYGQQGMTHTHDELARNVMIAGGVKIDSHPEEVTDDFMGKTGMIRTRVEDNELVLEMAHPFTSSQRSELKNVMIENNFTPEDIYVELVGEMKSEGAYRDRTITRIKRALQAAHDESKVDRHPAGASESRGGRFAKKGGGSLGSKPNEKRKLWRMWDHSMEIGDRFNMYNDINSSTTDAALELLGREKTGWHSEKRITADQIEAARAEADEIQGLLDKVGAKDKSFKDYIEQTRELPSKIQGFVDEYRTVFRGTTVENLINVIEAKGVMGAGKEASGHARDDYVPTTISEEYARNRMGEVLKKADGIVIEYDTSEISAEDMAPTKYEIRPDYSIDEKHNAGRFYRPWDSFDGTAHAGFAHELEMKVKKGARARIRSVSISERTDPDTADALDEYLDLYGITLRKTEGLIALKLDRKTAAKIGLSALDAAHDESKVNRHPEGAPESQGGRFAEKDSEGAASSDEIKAQKQEIDDRRHELIMSKGSDKEIVSLYVESKKLSHQLDILKLKELRKKIGDFLPSTDEEYAMMKKLHEKHNKLAKDVEKSGREVDYLTRDTSDVVLGDIDPVYDAKDRKRIEGVVATLDADMMGANYTLFDKDMMNTETSEFIAELVKLENGGHFFELGERNQEIISNTPISVEDIIELGLEEAWTYDVESFARTSMDTPAEWLMNKLWKLHQTAIHGGGGYDPRDPGGADDINKAVFQYRQIYDMFLQRNPELRKQLAIAEGYAHVINREAKEVYDSTDTIFRGSTQDELDNYLEHGVFGTNENNYQYTAMSISRSYPDRLAGNGILIEYDAEAIRENGVLVPYSAKTQPFGISKSIRSGIQKDLHRPMSLGYWNEAEVRMGDGRQVYNKETGDSMIKKITFRNLGEQFRVGGTRIPHEERVQALRDKYSALADDLVFLEDGLSSDAKKYNPLSGSRILRLRQLIGAVRAWNEDKVKRHKKGASQSQGGRFSKQAEEAIGPDGKTIPETPTIGSKAFDSKKTDQIEMAGHRITRREGVEVITTALANALEEAGLDYNEEMMRKVEEADLEEYKRDTLERIRSISGPLVDDVNASLLRQYLETADHVKTYHTVYRGTDVENLVNVIEAGGEVGAGRETVNYGKDHDFVSTTISLEQAADFAPRTNPVIIEYDTSPLTEDDDWVPVDYELRPTIMTPREDGSVYRPFEKFGGSHSAVYKNEGEVHLRKGAFAKIRRVMIDSGTDNKIQEQLKHYLGKHGIKLDYDYTENTLFQIGELPELGGQLTAAIDRRIRRIITALRAFNEGDHNRHPEGADQSQGGRFAKKGEGGGMAVASKSLRMADYADMQKAVYDAVDEANEDAEHYMAPLNKYLLNNQEDPENHIPNSHLMDPTNMEGAAFFFIEREQVDQAAELSAEIARRADQIPELQEYRKKLQKVDDAVEAMVDKYQTVWRATNWENVKNVVESGLIGEGRDDPIRNDTFVSATADMNYVVPNLRSDVAFNQAIMIEYDTSEMKKGRDWQVLRHELRPGFSYPDEDSEKPPHLVGEKFGGSKGVWDLDEAEVHLRPGAAAKIRQVHIPNGLDEETENTIIDYLQEHGIEFDWHHKLHPDDMEPLTAAVKHRILKIVRQLRAKHDESKVNRHPKGAPDSEGGRFAEKHSGHGSKFEYRFPDSKNKVPDKWNYHQWKSYSEGTRQFILNEITHKENTKNLEKKIGNILTPSPREFVDPKTLFKLQEGQTVELPGYGDPDDVEVQKIRLVWNSLPPERKMLVKKIEIAQYGSWGGGSANFDASFAHIEGGTIKLNSKKTESMSRDEMTDVLNHELGHSLFGRLSVGLQMTWVKGQKGTTGMTAYVDSFKDDARANKLRITKERKQMKAFREKLLSGDTGILIKSAETRKNKPVEYLGTRQFERELYARGMTLDDLKKPNGYDEYVQRTNSYYYQYENEQFVAFLTRYYREKRGESPNMEFTEISADLPWKEISEYENKDYLKLKEVYESMMLEPFTKPLNAATRIRILGVIRGLHAKLFRESLTAAANLLVPNIEEALIQIRIILTQNKTGLNRVKLIEAVKKQTNGINTEEVFEYAREHQLIQGKKDGKGEMIWTLTNKDPEDGDLPPIIPLILPVPIGKPVKKPKIKDSDAKLKDTERITKRYLEFLIAQGLILSPKEADEARDLKSVPSIADRKHIAEYKKKKLHIRIEYVTFVTKNDEKVDDVCRQFHGIKFQLDSPALPILPLHHNCRCWYADKNGRRIGQF